MLFRSEKASEDAKIKYTMKTLELKLKKDVLIVEIPRLADYEFINRECKYLKVGNEEIKLNASTLDKFEFLCKGSELTEEIASEFFEYDDFLNCFEAYIDTVPSIDKSALKLFIKIFESKGFYWLEKECDNQFCENGKVDLGYNAFLNCQVCEELEEKTFRNPLIFVKK